MSEQLFRVIPIVDGTPIMYKKDDGSWWFVKGELEHQMLPPGSAVAPRYKAGEQPCEVMHKESRWYCTRVQGHNRDWHVAHSVQDKTLARWRADR